MNKGLKLFVLAASVLGGTLATGCNNDKQDTAITKEQGEAWAKDNGYIKYADSFTSASKTDESSYKAIHYTPDEIVTASALYHGTYLYATTNPDGSTNLSWFPFKVQKNAEENYYFIEQTLTYNDDGSKNQTALNLEANRKGMAYFISHGMKEVSATASDNYVALEPGTEYVKSTYYRYDTTDGKYKKIRTAAAPDDWETGTYYRLEGTIYTDAHATVFYDGDGNSEVYGAKMYFEVVGQVDYKSSGSDTATGQKYTLKITKFEPVV